MAGSLQGVLAGIPGLGGYAAGAEESRLAQTNQLQQMGMLQQIAEKAKERGMLNQFRADLQQLGPEASQEQLAQVAAKYAGPGDILKSQTSSLDRKAAIEATSATRAMALEQAKANALQAHEFRMAKATTDADRVAETARHNRTMEGISNSLLSIKSDTAAQGGKPPIGYRATPEGNLEAIPGGPADTKIQGALNQDTASMQSMQSDLDRLANEANAIKNSPGLGKATGMMSVVPVVGGLATIPGTDAANFKARLETLKSQVAFGVLQNMRNNSKTGGALGQVSDKEGALLQANLAALDRAQSPEEFRAALGRIVDYTEQAKDRLRNAYNMKHGGKPNAAPTPDPAGGPVRINGDAEYNALPSGTQFIGPDGKTRTKP